jgi:hypothetical protein
MNLTKDTIAVYTDLLTKPNEHGLDIPALSEVIETTEEATAKYLIYELYLVRVGRSKHVIPKVVFYIIMDNLYPIKKDEGGYLGYCVRVKPFKEEM